MPVFEDEDIGPAVRTIAGPGYYKSGQDCTAATRVLSGKGVYDEVVAGLAAEKQGLVVGDAMPADTTLG